MNHSVSRRDFLAISAAAGVAATAGPEFDVAVYGGVPCGIASAIAASRQGARVLLIEPTKHIGGLSTSGINTAESEHMLHWTIGGLALEFYKRLGKHYGTEKPEFFFESSVAEKVYLDMLREAKVTVRYGERVASAQSGKRRIQSLRLTGGDTIVSKVFVDASYEGDLMARAHVSYASGRESRSEFSEEAAGVRLDQRRIAAVTVDGTGRLLPGISAWGRDLKEGDRHRGVMNYNFRLTFARDPALQAPIPAPQDYNPARFALLENWLRTASAAGRATRLVDILDFYPRRNGKFEVNNKQAAIISLGHFGGQFDYPDADYDKRAGIVADHREYTLGLLHFLRNHESVPAGLQAEARSWGLHVGEFADNGHFPYQLYIREARRMRGAFVMTQRDATTDRLKADAVGVSSHFIDSHHIQRVALSPTEFVNEGRIWRKGWAYQIPYRALTPKPAECTNLLTPGAASFSHVAFCSYRLESVWMIGGHAAGVAAAMAAAAGTPVQDLPVADMQKRLRLQQQVIDFIPDVPQKWEGNLGSTPEI